MHQPEKISIYGAKEHNLKNVSLDIPRDKLVVITGLSGSGKSSLAFDTIYQEGQRRYMETFSSYVRQFIGSIERPAVDKIEGLSPVISIEQKTVSKNPRSTIGTITEIYDFLRLLFARASTAISPVTDKPMISYSDEQIKDLILKDLDGQDIVILSPSVRSRKGHYRELFESLRKLGFVRARVDGKITEIEYQMKLDRYKTHDIEIVIDRLNVSPKNENRLFEAIKTAMYHSEGTIMILDAKENVKYFSRHLMCPESGISYQLPEPNTFSFNSPKGYCPNCKGLGEEMLIDLKKVIPDQKKSIKKGGIAPLGEYKKTWIFSQIEAIAKRHKFTIDTPIKDIPEDALHLILYGGEDSFTELSKDTGVTKKYEINFEGVAGFIKSQYEENDSKNLSRWAMEFMEEVPCTHCQGTRLKPEALCFKVAGKNISEIAQLSIEDLYDFYFFAEKTISARDKKIAEEIFKELKARTNFLLDVGLGYLSLSRSSKTLSGGEAQRIRLATQIGSQLVGVLYILDEPSIGLHQRDNQKLINSLEKLRDSSNSVIVVEHDKDMILAADHIIDVGPKAGLHGGHIIWQGTPNEIKNADTLTAQYITGAKKIEIPKKRRQGNGNFIEIKKASGNNLKNISVKFPLGKLICVSGVSGSGKSTLINETLYPILNAHFFNALKKPLPYKSIEGLEHIDKVIAIDQSPIGRTPRSNPATYTGVFSDIRNLFAETPEAKIRGYKPGRFSFNVVGGRCEECSGAGLKVIDMNFLPDVHIHCEACDGKRYNRETLEIRYKSKSISDVLNMPVDEAVIFFENIPSIYRKIKTLQDVGLGYITLGQQSTTLSGGEAQRVKLATELSKKDTGKTFYILDEPTTGLHFEDINVLMKILQALVDKGNTVLVIEHNMDVIKLADHVIDIGAEGGEKGGYIIAEGTPEQVANSEKSFTAPFLKQEL